MNTENHGTGSVSDNSGNEPHLQGLNNQQKEAVLTTEGPLLILAGAGAGKTKTVTHRILHLVHSGVAPEEILAITFTNKAAKEMRERVEHMLAKERDINLPLSLRAQASKPFLSTFHSLGVHILKENAVKVGIPRNFCIFDKADSKKAVKEAIEAANLDPKQFEPGKIQNAISREKGNFVNIDEFEANTGNEFFPQIVARVWRKYEQILHREKSLDFDDLLAKTAKLLKNDAEVRAYYQKKWKYIHIDEYQDTNNVQYTISKLLADGHRNLCAVGDIDQMIYSWRGATIKNILNFEKDYPEAKVILLEENYRSTQTILAAANRIIKKNKQRREKNLFTKNVAGEKIGLFGAYDEAEEAYFIAGKAKDLIEGRNADNTAVSPREIAVLYRANFQSRVLEEALLSLNVPYQVLGTRFFERKEIKDVLSFIRAALNPDSSADIARIINIPARGIGKVTLLKVLAHQEETLPANTRKKIEQFRQVLADIKEKVQTEKASELIKFVMKRTGMEDALTAGTEEDQERLENIKELVTLATKYDFLSAQEGAEKLLEDAALASDQDTLEKNEAAVKLMTIHAAKGLEFDYVFVTGLEDGLFPHHRAGNDEDKDDEEERRLFYVALTRARKKLFLSFAGVRTIFGSRQVNIPSEFITDIEDDLLEQESTGPRGAGKYLKTIYFE